MSQVYTHAYLMGIRDGRALLATHERATGSFCTLEDARQFLANCKACLAMGFTGETRDAIKGEADFWRGWIKRHIATRRAWNVAA